MLAPPQAWTKHGELFSDEESRSIFVCSQCMEHVEHFELGFMASDAVTFWTHIQAKHMTPNSRWPKSHQNYSSEGPLRKRSKIQDIVIIDLDLDDDDDTVENCDLIAKKVAEISKTDNDTTNPILPQSQYENVTDKELGDVIMDCKVEQTLLASQNDMLNSMEFINQKDEEKHKELEPMLATMMANETLEEVKAEAKLLVAENQTDAQETPDTSEHSNCPAVEADVVTDNSDSGDLLTIAKQLSVDEYHSYLDLTELPDEDDDEDDCSSSSTLSAAALESRSPTTTGYNCTCPWCKDIFTDGALFSEHMKMHEKKEKSKCQTKGTAVVPVGLPSPLLPPNKVKLSSPSPSAAPPTHPPSIERTFKCNFCPEAFCGAWQLDRHHSMHLQNLKKQKTSALRPFQCNTCGKRTATEKAMFTHQHRFHSDEDSPDTTNCTVCGKLILERNLKKHMDVHAADRPRHHCHLCNLSFNHKQTHKNHVKNAHGPPSSTSPPNSDNSRFDLNPDNNAKPPSNNERRTSDENTPNDERTAMLSWFQMHIPPPHILPESAAAEVSAIDARLPNYLNPFHTIPPMHPNFNAYLPRHYLPPYPPALGYEQNLRPKSAEQYPY